MPILRVPASFFIRRARLLLWLCALASLSAPASRHLPQGWAPRLQWALELAAHWQWVYLACGTACLLLLLCLRRSGWLAILALVFGSCFFVRSAALERLQAPVGADAVLAVGTANLHHGTADFDPLVRWLLSPRAPDLVFLQEFTAGAQRALRHPQLVSRYPHRIEEPQDDPFGLAILSRHPLTDARALEPVRAQDTLRLRATVDWRGVPVRISAVHPMPPLSADYAQARDRALREEAAQLADAGGLGLLAGDLNTTPWAGELMALGTQLRRASGTAGTWPNAGGWLSALPLDHVLVSPNWRLVDAGSGPDLGSDHRPVVVRLAVAPLI